MLVCKFCHLVLADSESICSLDGSEGVETPLEPLDSKLSERFKGAEPFARGHTGFIYRAEDLVSGRRGLLKVLRLSPETQPAKWARIVRDLDKQKSLTDQHVAAIYDASEIGLDREAGKSLWLFRPLLEGVPLSVHLKKERTLKVPEALAVIAQIATGLDAIHRAGLLHRDLKPGHVILRPQPSGVPFVSLIDTGIAAPIETKSLFDLVGTAAYISPEHASGKAVSFRSDLYALGCILYEMLTGGPPFVSNETDDLLRSHQEKPFEPLQLQLPEPVAALAASLLSKEPRGRPFSAQQVRRTLEPFLPESTPAARVSQSLRPLAPAAFSTRPPPPGGASGEGRSSIPPPPSKEARRSVPRPPPVDGHKRNSIGAPNRAFTRDSVSPAGGAFVETSLEELTEEDLLDHAAIKPKPATAESPTLAASSEPISDVNVSLKSPRAAVVDPTIELRAEDLAALSADASVQKAFGAAISAHAMPSPGNGIQIQTPLRPESSEANADVSREGALKTPLHPGINELEAMLSPDNIVKTPLRPGVSELESMLANSDLSDDEATKVMAFPHAPAEERATSGQPKALRSQAREMGDEDKRSNFDGASDDDSATSRFDKAHLADLIPTAKASSAGPSEHDLATDNAPTSRYIASDLELTPSSSPNATSEVNVNDAGSTVDEGTLIIETGRGSLQRKVGVVAVTALIAAAVVYSALRWSEPRKVTVVSLQPSVSVKSGVSAKPISAVTPPSTPLVPAASSIAPQVAQPQEADVKAAAPNKPVETKSETENLPEVKRSESKPQAAAPVKVADEKVKTADVGDKKVDLARKQSKGGRGTSKPSVGAPLGNRTAQVETLKEKARAHFQAGRYAAAASAYKEATKRDPANAGSYAGLGASLLAINDADGAVAAYQRAIQLSPKSSGYHAALGRTYFTKGDKARAIKAYKKALEVDPNNRVAQMALQRLSH